VLVIKESFVERIFFGFEGLLNVGDPPLVVGGILGFFLLNRRILFRISI
jgi:hypothetical protein